MSNLWQRFVLWSKEKGRLVQSWLQEGADPLTLAKSAGIGFALGLCPILGVTTILCLGALVIAKWVGVELHAAMALLANLISVPVELAMILPHMRVGEFVTGSPHMQVVKIHLSDLWKGHLAGDLLVGLWHAILGWLLLLALEAAVVTIIMLPVFKYVKSRFGTGVAYVGLETDDVFAHDEGLQLTPSLDDDDVLGDDDDLHHHHHHHQASSTHSERSAASYGRVKKGRRAGDGEEALLST